MHMYKFYSVMTWLKNMIVLKLILLILGIKASEIGRPVNHYYLGFFKNSLHDDRHIFILLTSTETYEVQYTIEAPGINYYHNGTISAINEVILNLSTSVQVTSDNYDKGIYLTSVSDKITVIGQSLGARSSESFFALPIIWLNDGAYIYYAISVPKTTVFDSSFNSSILIVGTENNTIFNLTVMQSATITMSTITTLDLIPSIQYSFTINRLQTAYITSLQDLSGTKVISDKPITVSTGHECANIPWNIAYCNHLVEQIPPTALWGTYHYIAPLAHKTSYSIKILAAQNFTDINIYCNNTQQFYTINEGEFVNKTLSMQEYCAINSNKKVLVAQFSHGEGYFTAIGDPMMTLVPSTNQYLNEFDFSTLHNSSFNHYINIIVMAEYYQPNMIYLVAGGVNTSLATQQWVPVQVNSVTEAYATQVSIPVGMTRIFHSNPASQLTVIVYGFAQGDGYGHIGGFHILAAPATAPHSLTVLAVQSTFVILSWMAPVFPNGIITQYEVRYRRYNDTVFKNFNISSTMMGDILTGRVEDVLPLTNIYIMQLRAYTQAGPGPFGDSLILTEFSDPVLNVTINSVSSSTLTLTWSEPIVPYGVIISHYIVFYLPLSDPYDSIGSNKKLDGEDEEFALNFTRTTGALPDLNGSVTYRIQVSAVYVTLYNGLELSGNRSTEVTATTAEGGISTLGDNYSHNDERNNTAILAALGALIVILLVGLIISIVVNIWLYLKNKRMTNKLCHGMVTYTKHKGSSKLKETTTSNLHEVGGKTNPIYENKTVEILENPTDSVRSTIKMDDRLQKGSNDNELLYDVVQIRTDKKPNNEEDIMMNVNPSYNTSSAIKVNDNLRKVKGQPIKPTRNVVQLSNQKSNFRMKKVNPHYGVNTAVNDNT